MHNGQKLLRPTARLRWDCVLKGCLAGPGWLASGVVAVCLLHLVAWWWAFGSLQVGALWSATPVNAPVNTPEGIGMCGFIPLLPHCLSELLFTLSLYYILKSACVSTLSFKIYLDFFKFFKKSLLTFLM